MARTLVSTAGMHYVLFRLLRQGTSAALAPPGARKGDNWSMVRTNE
jgi:hypothetical protein